MPELAGEPIAARLAEVEAIAAARKTLAGREGAWVVGGAVRDAALGREVVDVDLALADDVRAAAQALARDAGGTAFELSSEFETWRAIGPARAWTVDLTALRGETIEADLALRDFTLNAIAVPLGGSEAIDPTGGLADLAGGVLRAVSERSFADDPLRVLRAARIGSGLGLELDSATVELGRRESARAAEPAGERLLAELRGLVCGPEPIRGLGLLDELGATAAVLPELEALKGLEQNPNHHLDAHGHTLAVLERWLEIEREIGRYAPGEAERTARLLAEPLADEMTRGEAMRFGCLVHDWGKPATRAEREGWIIFPGHDHVGATLIETAFQRLRSSRALRRHLAALTLHHLRLGFLARERPLPARVLHDYLTATAPVAADVTLLTVADRLSARGGGATASEQMIEAHLALAAEVMPAALDRHFDGPPRPPLDGDELRALGIAPGPRLGEILDELTAAAFAGEITDRAEAEARARELAAG